jgi:hypothetical protein
VEDGVLFWPGGGPARDSIRRVAGTLQLTAQVLLAVTCSATAVWTKQLSVTGTVRDAQGAPISGVSVEMVAPEQRATKTDLTGTAFACCLQRGSCRA